MTSVALIDIGNEPFGSLGVRLVLVSERVMLSLPKATLEASLMPQVLGEERSQLNWLELKHEFQRGIVVIPNLEHWDWPFDYNQCRDQKKCKLM